MIGRSVLSRLLSRVYRATKIEFSEKGFDLTNPKAALGTVEYFGETPRLVVGVEGTVYFVWGMELGYRELPGRNGTKFLDRIDEVILANQGFIPTHIIVNIWKGGRNDPNHKDEYVVYRFTQAQDEMLRNYKYRHRIAS